MVPIAGQLALNYGNICKSPFLSASVSALIMIYIYHKLAYISMYDRQKEPLFYYFLICNVLKELQRRQLLNIVITKVDVYKFGFFIP